MPSQDSKTHYLIVLISEKWSSRRSIHQWGIVRTEALTTTIDIVHFHRFCSKSWIIIEFVILNEIYKLFKTNGGSISCPGKCHNRKIRIHLFLYLLCLCSGLHWLNGKITQGGQPEDAVGLLWRDVLEGFITVDPL